MSAGARLAAVPAHENRGRQKRGPYSNPTPTEVLAARTAAGLTQTEAAEKIRGRLRSWQHYEEPIGSDGHRHMPAGMFELFLIKTGQPLPDWMKRDEG